MKENVKKIILIVLACLMIFSLVFASASSAFALDGETAAQNIITTDDGFEYTVYEDKVTIVGYGGEESEIDIPAEIEGLPVTEIGPRAFEAKTGVVEVTVPDSVISISGSAFADCSSLVIVNIGSGVSLLGNDAFAECINLTAIFVSENNTSFASENGVLFSGDKTRLIYYPQGDSRESYEVPSTVKIIGNAAFAGANRLKNVTFPSTLTVIDQRAFMGCENIKSLTIPNSVESIGAYAFASMTLLDNIVLPASLSGISEAMLSQCTSLSNINMPASIKKIGVDAFSYCTALESLTLYEGVEQIEIGAFTKCKALSSITLPSSLKSIDKNSFATCDALAKVNFAGTETQWNLLNCSIGKAMIVYNFVYGSQAPQKPETSNSNSSTTSSDVSENLSSGPAINGNTSSDVTSDTSGNSSVQSHSSRPQNQNVSSNSFVAAGENITFFKNGVLTLSGDKNALPEKSVIECREITEGIDFVKVKAAIKDRTAQFEVYDLSITKNSNEITLDTYIKAEFKIPKDYDMKKVQIIFVSDRGGAVYLKSRVNKKDATVSAQIDKTGTYVVAQMHHNTQGPSVGAVTLIIAAIILAGFILAYVFIYKPQYKK